MWPPISKAVVGATGLVGEAMLACLAERKFPVRELQLLASERSAEAQAAMHAWQSEWDRFNQGANEPAQQAQVERTRINHLEQQEVQIRRRLARNEEERQHLSDVSLQAEISELQRRESEGQAGLLAVREGVEARIRSITDLREQTQHAQEELAAARAELQTLKGRLASLQALQQAARGEGGKQVETWLGEQGLENAARLLETLQVSDRWQDAVEIVLAEQLQAVMVDGLERPAVQLCSP